MHDANKVWSDWVEEYDLVTVNITRSAPNPTTGLWWDGQHVTMFKCDNCGALYQEDHDADTMFIDRMVWDTPFVLEGRDPCRCDVLPGTWDLETLETV